MLKIKTIKKLKVFLGGFLVLSFFILPFLIKAADSGKEQLRQDLNNQINQLQQQIKDYQQKISENQQKAKSLNTEIQILEDKISAIKLQVEQTDLAIKETNYNIEDVEENIGTVETKIDQEKAVLAEYIRTINQYDQETILEIVLEKEKFSDFFEEVSALESAQGKVQDLLDEIRKNKEELTQKKSDLEDERDEQYRLKSLQVLQRRSVENNQNDKEKILTQTKGQEKKFQELVAQNKRDIEFIKKQVYLLEGVGLSMTLEEALKHALFATTRTGIRPAFLLAVLKKESSWGTNVGTGTWRSDMNPKQQDAFIQICKELGKDPDQTPVSKKPSYGWGGAMGPAQFLPLTWLGYKDQVAAMTGHNPPDPWNIDDAFTASAIKLSSNGANQRTSQAEHKAAMIYFAGSNWNKPQYQWYADQVMELADVIQQELDKIQGN